MGRLVAPRSRPKIVLAGIGTRGDLFPLLALGRELVSRGYTCDLLSNQGYEEFARSHGLAFRPVTVAQTNNLVSGLENFEGHVFPSYEPTFEYFAEQVARGEQLAVINLDECSASNLVSELYGLPLVRVVLAPARFTSVYRPAWPLNKKLRGPMAATYQRYRLPQIYDRTDRAPVVLSRINPFRARLGLPPLSRFSQIDRPVSRQLGFFPAWFGDPQPDWPANLELVGFPLPDSRGCLAPELEAFLGREGKPLVFTPGTGVVDVEGFFADAKRCCEQLDRAGIFLSPHYRHSESTSGPRIFHAAFVDLQLLLERSALIVHHGGIGTTARALQAGVPQIIRSVAYDQPDNGERITELGLGTFFEPAQCKIEQLLRDTQWLLEDAGVQQRLAQRRREIAGTNAVEDAADRIELTFSEPLARQA
jgi:rhamnosyltransferase subunit B